MSAENVLSFTVERHKLHSGRSRDNGQSLWSMCVMGRKEHDMSETGRRMRKIKQERRKEMKRKTLIMGLIGMIILQPINVQAADCANGAGTEIKGNDHGAYCLSKATMNWWSAHAWCDAIGMKLVPLNECECRDESKCDMMKQCPNLYNIGSAGVWTTTPSGSSSAYHISLSTGNVVTATRTGNASVLCL